MATKDISDVQVVLAFLESKEERALHSGIDTPADPYPWPYVILERRTGQCHKVCYRAMERADRRGFLEYGTSLRSGWVTPAGLELVANELKQRHLTGEPAAQDFLTALAADARRAVQTAAAIPLLIATQGA